MKKLFLLGALICAGQLCGMEPENLYPGLGSFGYLPSELHRKIIQDAIASSDTLEKAVKAINAASIWGVQYDNLKAFTTLVHILANQFDVTTAEVASNFNTPTAQEYTRLGHHLLDFAGYDNDKITELLNKGADANFSSYNTPLGIAIRNRNLQGVELLLKLGAKPTDHDLLEAQSCAKYNPEREGTIAIKDLIEKAMQKQS